MEPLGSAPGRSLDETSLNYLENASFIGGEDVPGAEVEPLEIVPNPFSLDDGWSARF